MSKLPSTHQVKNYTSTVPLCFRFNFFSTFQALDIFCCFFFKISFLLLLAVCQNQNGFVE